MRRSLYIGPEISGKNYAAGLSIGNRPCFKIDCFAVSKFSKSNWVDSLEYLLATNSTGAKIIFVQDVPIKYLEAVCQFFYQDEYTVNPKGKPAYSYRPDEIIITSTCELLDVPVTPSLVRRFDIFNCGAANAAGVAMMFIDPKMFSAN